MGIFSGIGDVETTKSSLYLTEGDYLLSLTAIKLIESKRKASTFFIVEGFVKESTGDGAIKVGEEVCWMCKMGGDYPEAPLKDVKSFIYSVTGATKSQIDEAFITSIIENDGEACVGHEVQVHVALTKTKANKDFSKHSWRPARQE